MKYDKAGSPQKRRILAYTPYGETFIEERDVTPYKFNDSARREQNQAMLGLCRAEACLRAKHNGKELDAETGLYYYGARYYDPTTALWLGVDLFAKKYSEVNLYVYSCTRQKPKTERFL